jgi:hypothetical protein
MTWSLSAAGHNENNSEDAEKAILKGVLDGLEADDVTVSSLSFTGNYVQVTTLDQAKEKTSE